MKPSPTNRLLSAALVATGFALSLCFSQAASLSWDGSDTVTAGAQGGSGTWDTNNTANWWDGSTNVVWPSVSSGNDDAVFANTNGTVTLSGAVTVNDMTIGTAGYTLTGGTLNFDGATPTITTLAGDTTISSGITGSNGLTKDGAGTLRFFNNNGGFSNLTYTGVTNVNAGTLTYDFGSAGGNTLSMGSTSGIAIASGATVELSNTQIGTDGAILGTGVPGGMFTGTGTLKKTGAGYLGVSWSGANDTLSAFNGTIQVAQGTLGVNRGSGSTAGNGKATLQIDSGATVDVRTGIFAVDALNGAGTVIASFGGGNTLSLGNNNGSGSFAGSLQGGLALIKNGTGTQTLTNASSFTGGTTVNAGTLAYQFSSRPGWNHNSFNTANIGNVAVASGATLELNSVDNTTENANFSSGIFSGAGTISKTGAGQISFNAGSSINTFTGQINVVNGTLQTNGSNWNTAGIGTGQMSMNISSGAAFDIRTGGIRIDRLTGFGRVTVSHTAGGSLSVGNNNGSSLFSGIIQNGGSAPSLTKNGTGIFTLAGANTFTGTTTIAGGTLAIGASGSINSSAVTVQNTATLQTNAVGKTMAGLTLQDGSTLTLAAANGSTSITAPLTLSATPNFTVKPIFSALPTAGNITLVSSSSAPGAAGTITTDFSTFGATRVTGSTALSGNDLVLTITTGAANLIWNNAGANSTWDHNTSSNFNNGGSDDKFMSFDAVTFDDTATAGVVTLTGTLASSALTVNTANTYTFAGSGSIAGAGTLTKQGAGTLVLNTANTYSGNTTITAGTLTIGGAGTLGTGAVYGGAISNAGTLNYASSSNQTLAGVISGSGGLTMSGSGTLTLNNAQSNTYTGNTTVNAGTLVEKTSNTGGWTRSSNNTSINNGGTLQLDMSSQVANLQPNNIKAITVNSGGTLELKGSINFIDGSYINAGSV
ncbi:MAG TPA: autotransporter-associated beta strand repeat-containing protein, partial [Luteolibacter sp.]